MIRPGQWCIVKTKLGGENDGRIVQAIRPEQPPEVSCSEKCWKVGANLDWVLVNSRKLVRLPYSPEQFLHPLPDLDEPVEDYQEKTLDKEIEKEHNR